MFYRLVHIIHAFLLLSHHLISKYLKRVQSPTCYPPVYLPTYLPTSPTTKHHLVNHSSPWGMSLTLPRVLALPFLKQSASRPRIHIHLPLLLPHPPAPPLSVSTWPRLRSCGAPAAPKPSRPFLPPVSARRTLAQVAWFDLDIIYTTASDVPRSLATLESSSHQERSG